MSLASMLRSRVTLQRKNTMKDTSGGPLGNPAQPFSDVSGQVNVPCAIHPASADTRERFAQLGVVVTSTIYLAKDIGARASDRLVSGTRKFMLAQGGYMAGADGYSQWPAVAHVEEVTGGSP